MENPAAQGSEQAYLHTESSATVAHPVEQLQDGGRADRAPVSPSSEAASEPVDGIENRVTAFLQQGTHLRKVGSEQQSYNNHARALLHDLLAAYQSNSQRLEGTIEYLGKRLSTEKKTSSDLRKIIKDQEIVYKKREGAFLENCVVTKKLNDVLLETNRSLRNLRDRATAMPYARVLIDGHDFIFHPNYLSQGLEGGRLAEQLLIERVHRYFQDRKYEDYRRWIIMVEIIADIDDWGDKNQAVVSFAHVDGGKEITDWKLTAELEIYLQSIDDQCKHVILACSSDHGMLGVLDPYKDNVGFRDRITFVETTEEPAYTSKTALFNKIHFPDLLIASSELLSQPDEV